MWIKLLLTISEGVEGIEIDTPEFKSDIFKLISFALATLTSISGFAIPLIINQRKNVVASLNEKLQHLKDIERRLIEAERRLTDCIRALEEIKSVCEDSERSSQIFCNARKADMVNYYGKVMYSISEIVETELEQQERYRDR